MMDLFGNIQQQQEQMERKLKEVEIIHTSGDQLVTLKINANKEILDLTINRDKFNDLDPEQLEDQLVVTFNEAFEKAAVEAEKISKETISDLLPGGMEGLSGLFGK